MTQDEVFTQAVRILEDQEFQYMICGSVAAILYGEPRMTNDMDIVVAVLPQQAGEFFQAFDSAGFYCPPPEVLESELRAHGQFNLLHHESGVKIDCIVLRDDAFNREEFRRRQRLPLNESQQANVATPEDVILGKLRFFRMGGSEKHLTDIRGMIAVSADEIDFRYIESWVKKLGLEKEWEKVRPS